MQALALKMDNAVAHFRLGMSFKDLGMKAEAAECVRTALTLGLEQRVVRLGGSWSSWSARPAVGRRPRLAAGVARRPARSRPTTAVETGPFPHAVFVDDPLEQLKVARHYALHGQRSVRPLPRRAGLVARGAASAWATRRRISTSMPPAN